MKNPHLHFQQNECRIVNWNLKHFIFESNLMMFNRIRWKAIIFEIFDTILNDGLMSLKLYKYFITNLLKTTVCLVGWFCMQYAGHIVYLSHLTNDQQQSRVVWWWKSQMQHCVQESQITLSSYHLAAPGAPAKRLQILNDLGQLI